jgi:dihydrofolate synthase/folylpolyglutamate synthase
MPADPLPWLLGLEKFGIKFGLDNISAIVEALGHPERTFASVHVAGTNGKGSVTAMIEAALRTAGHRTGRYTSPHLMDLTERFAVDGAQVVSGSLVDAVADVRKVVDRLRQNGGLQADPTFFEVTTAVAFELFRRAAVDIAVCEVGLGGRLDATNVLEPLVTAITSIGIDHEEYLGGTLREIAAEKAGILKPGVPAVVGRVPIEALDAIADLARRRAAPLVQAWDGVRFERLEARPDGRTAGRLSTPAHDYGPIEIGLRGSHQVDNAVVAVRTLEALTARGVDAAPAAIVHGLAHVHWPGRLDIRRLNGGREVLLDAAHNPDGAAALADFVRETPFANTPLVVAVMRDKDAVAMIRALAPVGSGFIFTRASNSRSADPSELAVRARAIRPGVSIATEESPADALAAAWRMSPRIIVAGSIFLVGDVMNLIEGS